MPPSVPSPSINVLISRLEQLHATVTHELNSLPKPHAALTALHGSENKTALDVEIAALIKTLDDYWQASSAKGNSRRELFIEGLERALRDEVALKIQEGSLNPRYASCIPAQGQNTQANPPLDMFTLHVQLNDWATSEIAGALVFISLEGHCLLMLPGAGVHGFASRSALGNALAEWLNSDVLRHALFNNAKQLDQNLLATLNNDPHLFVEPFTVADLKLQPLTASPFEHAFERQLQKQRSDIRHACLAPASADEKANTAQLESAISMHSLVGPGAMLEQRLAANWEHQQRKNMPHWTKIASQEDLNRYQRYLMQYDLSRTALLSALGGAASHEQFALMRLRARLASDLGYDLEPAQITITTRRPLPITGETYGVTHSLPHLALYGLHPGDRSMTSAFMTQTTLSVDGTPLQADYPLLTSAYLANLIDELNLNTTFGEYQRTAYASEHNQQLMRELTRKQVIALAWSAKMQGHIEQSDFEIIEQIERDANGQITANLHVQQIRLNDGDVLGGMLVFCKTDSQERVERLVMFAGDAPGAQQFWGFHNQTRLLHELVSWTKSPEMTNYLLEQVPAPSREQLEKSFAALRLKPYPPANYLRLITRTHYHQALGQFVRQHVRVAAATQAQRTPDWYLRASATQRQELLSFEEAIAGATQNYQAKAHTKNQDFEAYVHQQASKKISELLGMAEGSVDPDQIIITTEREVLSYTQMLRNGYDDSLGMLSSSADTQATFKGPEHIDLSPLTPQKVARSVHGKWLSDDYIRQVRQTLLATDSPGYEYRRRTSLLITVLQMKAAALRSYLKGELDIRRYQWLKPSMDQLHRTDAQSRHNHPVYPLQLRLENPLIGSDLSTLGKLSKELFDTFKQVPVELTQVETIQGCYLLTQPGAGQAPCFIPRKRRTGSSSVC